MAEPASTLLYRWRSRWAEDLPVTGFSRGPDPLEGASWFARPVWQAGERLVRLDSALRPLSRAEANNLQLYGIALDWTKVLYSGYLASD